jgi:hypothetical protein
MARVGPREHSGCCCNRSNKNGEAPATRKLGTHSQRSHIYSCRRFAAFLKRSPDTATPDDVRRFQLHLAETGMSICNRNRIMTGVETGIPFRVRIVPPGRNVRDFSTSQPLMRLSSSSMTNVGRPIPTKMDRA